MYGQLTFDKGAAAAQQKINLFNKRNIEKKFLT